MVTDPVTPVQVRGHSVAKSPMASSPSFRKKEKKEKKGKVKKSVNSPLSVRISTSGAVPPAPAGSAGPSTSPMSPVGCSPRSRSRSPLAPGSDDDDKEELHSDESVNYRRRKPSDKRISNTVAREVQRAILKHKGKGEGVMDGVIEQILAKERRVASLENQKTNSR